MGRDEEPFRGLLQENFQKVSGVKPENRATVGREISHSVESAVYPQCGINIRNKEDVVYLADPAVPFIDTADFGGEEEPDRDGLGSHPGKGPRGGRGLQLQEPGFGRRQKGPHLFHPDGMSEVAGPHDVNPLGPGPGP